MNINDYRTIYVLFPPLWGGNHFANMLSLSPKISNRNSAVTDNDYLKNIESYYDSQIKNAHIESNVSNVGIHLLDDVYQTINASNKPFILAGHVDEAYFSFQKIKELGPILCIVFSLIDADKIKKREQKHVDGLSLFVYNEKIIKKIFNDDNIKIDTLGVDSTELCIEDASNLYQRFNTFLDLDLNLDLCSQLHKKWFNKI